MAVDPRSLYNRQERRLFAKLDRPAKIQDFLNRLTTNFETGGETCRSPRLVLVSGLAHCLEGAMLAAAILEFHGGRPLLLDLRASKPGDDDHVVAPFFQTGRWGAASKTNHAVLRYREPVYRGVRELAMSYFHEYFLNDGRKTMREYSSWFDLKSCDDLAWRTSEIDLFAVSRRLDRWPHHPVLLPGQARRLRRADSLEIRAGRLVADKPGRRR